MHLIIPLLEMAGFRPTQPTAQTTDAPESRSRPVTGLHVMSCHAWSPLEGCLAGSCMDVGEVTDSLSERSPAGFSSLPDVW